MCISRQKDIKRRLSAVKGELYPELRDAIENYGFDPANPYKHRWLYRRVIPLFLASPFLLYSLYCLLFGVCCWKTYLWCLSLIMWPLLAVTAGAHRLWSHHAFKATLPLRAFLMLLYSSANQQHIFKWVSDHRVHHRRTDTDADPHNSTRGLLFCHALWIFTYEHPEVTRARNKVDVSDLETDVTARLERRFHPALVYFLTFVIPTIVPYYCWDEQFFVSFSVCAVFKYLYLLNIVSCVNSYAHYFGTRPYDKDSTAADSYEMNAIFACGLGDFWHNFHHAFPWDYRAAEIPYWFNTSTLFLDIMQWMGQVYDTKIASPELVAAKKQKVLKCD